MGRPTVLLFCNVHIFYYKSSEGENDEVRSERKQYKASMGKNRVKIFNVNTWKWFRGSFFFCGTLVIVLFFPPKILFLIFILNSKSLWLCRGVIWFQSARGSSREVSVEDSSCTSYWLFFPCFNFLLSHAFTGCFSLLSTLITTPTLFDYY